MKIMQPCRYFTDLELEDMLLAYLLHEGSERCEDAEITYRVCKWAKSLYRNGIFTISDWNSMVYLIRQYCDKDLYDEVSHRIILEDYYGAGKQAV